MKKIQFYYKKFSLIQNKFLNIMISFLTHYSIYNYGKEDCLMRKYFNLFQNSLMKISETFNLITIQLIIIDSVDNILNWFCMRKYLNTSTNRFERQFHSNYFYSDSRRLICE